MATSIKTDLTHLQFEQLFNCIKNVFYFSQFIYVINPIHGKIRFNLYPYQKAVLLKFIQRRFNIVLKFRQAGLTELIAMYCLWLAMYHENKSIQIISIKDRVAKKVLRKIKFMYKNLPEHIRMPIINGKPNSFGTETDMEFENGSIITSIPTTEDAGRSEALTLLVIDEAAIIKYAHRIWAAAFPTLSTGGSAIVNSTPYGVGNWYHQEYTKACNNSSNPNEFNPIRLRWEMHPDRDINWYNSMRAALGGRRTAQEIDGDFLTSGNTVFDLMDIRDIEDAFEDCQALVREHNGNYLEVEEPVRGVNYYMGGDVSTGRARDTSAFSIMNRKGEEQGFFKGKMDTRAYAKFMMEKGKRWNKAMLAPETNDIGLAVVNLMQEYGYPNIYHFTKFVKEKGQRKPKVEKIPGWLTTEKTRPIIIDELETDIRTNAVSIVNPFFTGEAYTFIYDDQNRPIAMGKGNKMDDDELNDDDFFTDDAIIAECITNHIRKDRTNDVVVAPN